MGDPPSTEYALPTYRWQNSRAIHRYPDAPSLCARQPNDAPVPRWRPARLPRRLRTSCSCFLEAVLRGDTVRSRRLLDLKAIAARVRAGLEIHRHRLVGQILDPSRHTSSRVRESETELAVDEIRNRRPEIVVSVGEPDAAV